MIHKIFSMIKNVLIGMKTVGYHFFRKALTECFPEQKPKLPNRFRGKLALRKDENNKPACIGCKTCVGVCPAGAIEIETEKDEDNKLVLKKFKVNMGKCILCGNCEYFCPQKAILLTKDIEIAACDKEELELNINKLLISQKESSKILKRKYNV